MKARLLLWGMAVVLLTCGAGCSAVGGHRRGPLIIEGRGVGLPAADASTPDQKRMTACQAAYYRALADLAGKVYGTHIKQESKVVDMQFAGESLQAGISGMLEDVEVISNEYDPKSGMATAVVQVELDREGRRADGFRPGPITPEVRSER